MTLALPARIDWRLAVALLATDVCFIALHVAERLGWLPEDPLLLLSQDRGYGEWFQYAKELWICLLLAIVSVRRRSLVVAAFSLLYLYMLLDDSLAIHEQMGGLVASRLGITSHGNLRQQDFGELAIYAVIGACFLAVLALSFRHGDSTTKRDVGGLLLVTGVVAFFAVGVDMLDELLPIRGLTLLEESGEMLSMSAAVLFTFGVAGTVPQRAIGGILFTERKTAAAPGPAPEWGAQISRSVKGRTVRD